MKSVRELIGNIYRKWQHYRACRLEKYWVWKSKVTSSELKDIIGVLYIEDYLGFDPQITQAFIQGDHQAQHVIGMKQANLPCENVGKFWDRVNEVFPRTHRRREIAFLKKSGGPAAICAFLHSLKTWGSSPVLYALEVNAHVYK